MFEDKIQQVRKAETISYTGKIENIVGMSIEASGGRAAVGDICQIYNGESGGQVLAEVVGFKNDRMLLMPYSDMSGISSGNFVRNTGRRLSLMMGAFLKGRVINALGQPIDGKGPFHGGTSFCVERNQYINPMVTPPYPGADGVWREGDRQHADHREGTAHRYLCGIWCRQKHTDGDDREKCESGHSMLSPWWGSGDARFWSLWKRTWERRGCAAPSW